MTQTVIVERKLLEETKRALEANVSQHVLQNACPAYQDLNRALGIPQPRSVATLLRLFAAGERL